MSAADRVGRCYELAGRKIVDHPDGTLVHGTIQGGLNPRIGHAWVILDDGSVWEPVTDEEWIAGGFAVVFSAQVEVTYSWAEALAMQLEREHFGPYHDRIESIV